jgi:DNA-binding response OmpR family regulator
MALAKILLIDDDATMRILLKTLIELDGHTVVPLTDFSMDIPGYILRTQPNLVIMDVRLGRQNGIEILKAIRQTPGLMDLSVVMTSGMDTRDQCLQAGANSFIMKPYMPEELLTHIRNALKN